MIENWQRWKGVEPNHVLSEVFGPQDFYIIEKFNDIYYKRYHIPVEEIVEYVTDKAKQFHVDKDVSFQYKRDGNVRKILYNYYYSQIAIDRFCVNENPQVLDFGCGINVGKEILTKRFPNWTVDPYDIFDREWFLDEFAWNKDHYKCKRIEDNDFFDHFDKQYDAIILSRASFLTEADYGNFQLYIQKLSFLLKETGLFIITQPSMYENFHKRKLVISRCLNNINEPNYYEHIMIPNKPFVLVTRGFSDIEIEEEPLDINS